MIKNLPIVYNEFCYKKDRISMEKKRKRVDI